MFTFLFEIICAIRNIRTTMQLPSHIATDIFMLGETKGIEAHRHIISSLVRINVLHCCRSQELPGFSSSILGGVVTRH